jgi:RNA polymerase sigma-70 factor (sigma-E family)
VGVTYDEFVAARLQPLLRYAVMLTGDRHLAEDLVQETMVRAQLKWRRVAAADVPELYVKRMLTNAYVDARRGSWLRRVVLRADQDERDGVMADPAEQTVSRDYLWRLLVDLPPRQRAALVLRYYEGLADNDIAEVLGCAVGTVRASVSRALATLRLRVDITPTSLLTGGEVR